MKNYVLVSEKQWHLSLFNRLNREDDNNWVLINRKEDFNRENLSKINPDMVFIPHWSHIIKEDVFSKFCCVVFHMTDLPYGRGGSPLQNLIVLGHDSTKISALRVSKGIDEGAIYLKKDLSLSGTAQEIFMRSTEIIFSMIKVIIDNNVEPTPQVGEVVKFKRRKPADGDISNLKSLKEIFDYIRMLDAEGYPNAFLEMGEFRFEFSRVNYESTHTILADVRITKK